MLAVGQVWRPATRHTVRPSSLPRHAAAMEWAAGGRYECDHVRRAVAVLAVHAGPLEGRAGRWSVHGRVSAQTTGGGAGQCRRASALVGQQEAGTGHGAVGEVRLGAGGGQFGTAGGHSGCCVPAAATCSRSVARGRGDDHTAAGQTAERDGEAEGGGSERRLSVSGWTRVGSVRRDWLGGRAGTVK